MTGFLWTAQRLVAHLPRLREVRRSRGRRVETTPPLFPGYCFVAIALQWSTARWSAGVVRLVMDGAAPARVPDAVIAGIRSRERAGLVELPPRFKRGDSVRILHGPFSEHLAIYAGMAPHERVAVTLLGSRRRVTLAANAVDSAS